MKKIAILVLFLMLALMPQYLLAQPKNNGKAVIQTPSVQCEKCKARIENYLSRQYGVTSVKVDWKKKLTTVSWIPDRTDIEMIKAAIATVGYDADDVAAEESAYKKLPPSCKKPAEDKKADPKE